MLKVELHTHTADDRVDRIPHSTLELIDRAVALDCDAHRLWQLGTTDSLVDAPPDPDSICNAIAAGRVQVRSRPLAWIEAARVVAIMAPGNLGNPSPRNRVERSPATTTI